MLANAARIAFFTQWTAKMHDGEYGTTFPAGGPRETVYHWQVYNASTIVLSTWFSAICLCYFYEVQEKSAQKEADRNTEFMES